MSPGSPYVGLTSSLDAGQDEPERFYPSGKRNFGRLQLGDPAQALAQVSLMRASACTSCSCSTTRTRSRCRSRQIVAADAERAGITVAGARQHLATPGSVFTGEVEKIAHSGADAVFFAGGGGPGTVALWRALHAAERHLLLLGSSALAGDAFAAAIGPAGASTYLTTPILAAERIPARGRGACWRTTAGGSAGRPAPTRCTAIEAMSVVLDAIRRAGARGNDRQAVIDRFFATTNRDSVLGRYSVRRRRRTDVLAIRLTASRRTHALLPRLPHPLTALGASRRSGSAAGALQPEHQPEPFDASAEALAAARKRAQRSQVGHERRDRGVFVRPTPSSRPSSVGKSAITLG